MYKTSRVLPELSGVLGLSVDEYWEREMFTTTLLTKPVVSGPSGSQNKRNGQFKGMHTLICQDVKHEHLIERLAMKPWVRRTTWFCQIHSQLHISRNVEKVQRSA